MDRKTTKRQAPATDTVRRDELRVAIALMTQRRRDEILSRIVTKKG